MRGIKGISIWDLPAHPGVMMMVRTLAMVMNQGKGIRKFT
jgi:hypothetical protein